MKKNDLFLEEAVLDDLSKSFDSLELPLSERAFNLVVFFAVFIGLAVFVRVGFLGFRHGDFYKNRALANISEITFIPTERGLIFDRSDKPLVKNIPSFKVILKLAEFFKKNQNEQQEELKQMGEILNLPVEQINDWLKKVDLEKQNSMVLARDLTVEQVAKIKNLDFKDVKIEKDFAREYDKNGIFSHVLGYVGVASKEDLESDSDLLLNDLVGKAGLELYYNKELRGENGEIIDFRNAKNESVDQKTSVIQSRGNDLYLTIDFGLQDYFYRRLKNQLESLGRVGGVGIAVNPQNGEVLSLISLPSFDNNKISSGLLSNSSKPLFNRATNGVYNPGSTIKPLVAIAALVEKVVVPQKEIYSPGYLDVPNPYDPEHPSRFLDWRPQGWVNLYSAIARSSNVYFYEVGGGYGDFKGLGIERLRDYWKKFGLDKKTNIDLPGEKNGFLPDVEEKEKRTGVPWRLGDTYNNSIGQGDLMITPLELINYISAIANNGKAFEFHVVQKIVDKNGNLTKEAQPKILFDNSQFIDAIKDVQKGMLDAVQKSYGTANMLNSLPFKVAAKTGSAQIESNTKVNAFFVGYGPVENPPAGGPSLAILVLIENAREGSLNAVPVAKDVFEWYYENRIKGLAQKREP
ncbi:hypothetical protein HZB05_00925 [Candidatus Wolfebacteria bacterium]|nr:hypothetical protein [Candidatus Wolfebacteria bacterium]